MIHHFGKRLRRLRADRPQREVAAEIGIPQTTLSTLENQPTVPRGEVVEKLAAYYQVPVSYFYPPEPGPTSQKAKNWLESIAQEKTQASGVATHATLPMHPAIKRKIDERIQQEHAKSTHGSKDRR